MAIVDAVKIVNAAIARLGGNLIAGDDFTGTDVASVFANLNYEQLVQAELAAAPWRFARKTAACTLEDDPPEDTEWSYAWTLPDDVLILRGVIRNGAVIDYEISAEGEILTEFDDDVLAVYTYRADEGLWPSDFKEGITREFEALFLRADDRFQEADDREQSGEKVLARARLTHSQEEKASDPRQFPLIAARRIGYGCFRR